MSAKILAFQSLRESMEKLLRRYNKLKKSENLVVNITNIGHGNLADAQVEFVNHLESYFQGLYSTLGTLTATVNHFSPGLLHKKSIKSIDYFLKELTTLFPKISESLEVLERAREFRTYIDHIQQNKLHDWITMGYSKNNNDQERYCRVIYFVPSKKSKFKEIKLGDLKIKLPMRCKSFFVSPDHDKVHNAIDLVAFHVFERIKK